MKKIYPKISYCVFTYNEERNIEGSLRSIFSQDYPKDKLEVIVVDDNSTDRTLEIAKDFPVKIFHNGERDGDRSATIGFNNATGDFFTAVGADMRFRGETWFKKMVKPLLENPDVAVALTRYYSHSNDSLINKYLNLDPIQRDFVYQVFSPSIDETIVEKKKGYYLCKYSLDKLPPQTHGLYRVSMLKELVKKQKVYYDMGNLVSLVKKGYTKVAYVPEAGYYHFHAENILHLLKKRMRNIEKSYLRYLPKESHYKWFDLSKPMDIIKIISLIIGANLFLPVFFISIYRMFRHRELLYLLEAPVTLLLVDTILFSFLKDVRSLDVIRLSFVDKR